MQPSAEGQTDPKEQRAELIRLKLKLEDTTDPDIRIALQERIAQLESQIPKEEPEDEEPPPPATPEQIAEAEKLIVQARVERMRNNKAAANDLMNRAAAVAPGSPTVLEAVADDLAEQRKFGEAKKLYRAAVRLDPKNVGLERKFALCVHRTGAMGSVEDQMRSNLSDSPFLTQSDMVASAGAAVLWSIIWPGLGHVLLGRKGGFIVMAVWALCVVWVFSLQEDVKAIIGMAGGGSRLPNLTVMVPLLIMAVVFFGTIASLQTAKKAVTRKKVDRPVPPVDKPFEL